MGLRREDSNVDSPPADVARDKEETTIKRLADSQTVATTGVSSKEAQALNFGLFS